jgi:FkbM family methyltransferase
MEEVFVHCVYDRVDDYVPREGWIVLDVGANIGIVSMLEAQRGASVYAFEPNSDCFRRLLKNIVANDLQDRIFAFNLALGDKIGTGAMHVHKGGTTGGMLLDESQSSAGRTQAVTITRLDEVVATLGIQRIDLLKIDVEGAEVAVLRGGKSALAITRRLIIEYHSARLRDQVEELLARSGFVPERKIVYCRELASLGQEEVGLVYLRRVTEPACGAVDTQPYSAARESSRHDPATRSPPA